MGSKIDMQGVTFSGAQDHTAHVLVDGEFCGAASDWREFGDKRPWKALYGDRMVSCRTFNEAVRKARRLARLVASP